MSVHCSVYKFDPYKQVRYGPHLPLVLKGLTCTFPGGMKVGVVGRTGSGKSTLIQSIFRIVEPTKGRIVIDGIDISTIGLHDLRSKLSIILQEPTMFGGSIRNNLDPLEDHSDDEIWEVSSTTYLYASNIRESYIFRVLKYPRSLCKSSIPISFGSKNWEFGASTQLGRSVTCKKIQHEILECGLCREGGVIQPYLACIFLSIRGLERQHLTKLRSHGSLRVFQEQTGETDKVYLELEIRGKVELRRSPVQLHSNILDFRTGHPCD